MKMNSIKAMKLQKGYFIFKIFMALLINAAINFAFGYVFGTPIMPLWGEKGILADYIQMTFYLGTLLTWFTILDIHSDLGKKKVQLPPANYTPSKYFLNMSKNSIIRSLLFGVFTMIFFGSACIAIFVLANINELAYWDFIIVKVFFSMIMAFFLDPLVPISTLTNMAEDKLLLFVKYKIYMVPQTA